MTLPGYEFLAAPLWIITTLHVLTLALHFMAMNFLLGGAIIVAQAAIRRRPTETTARLGRLLPAAMAATVTLGVAPLLFVQLVFPRQIYSAAIVSAWFWLLVIPAAILAYYALYYASGRITERKDAAPRFAWLLPLAGLVYISLLYSSVFSLAERPDRMHALYAADPSGGVFNPALGDYGYRWLHMVLGAVTVGGFFAGWLGRNDPGSRATGRAFFIGGMIASALSGAAYLMSLQPYFAAFQSTPGMSALAVGVLLSAGSVYVFLDRKFLYAGLLLFGSMLSMVIVRHTVRLVKLTPTFDPASLPVRPQWWPFLIFLVSFVIALAVLGWMLRQMIRAGRNQPA